MRRVISCRNGRSCRTMSVITSSMSAVSPANRLSRPATAHLARSAEEERKFLLGEAAET